MVAMKGATENAKNIIGGLTLDYNKARQTQITNELLEITTYHARYGITWFRFLYPLFKQNILSSPFQHQVFPMMNNTGILVQIIGAVVDADFSQAETLPALLNALEVDYEVDGKRKTLVLEVQQHIGDGWVRAVAMSSTDGLRRGMPVRDTGRPIEVPVGQCVLGRIFNVLGKLWTSAADSPAPV